MTDTKIGTFFTNEVIDELSSAIQKNMQNSSASLPFGLGRDYSKTKPSLGDFRLTSPMVASMLEGISTSTIGEFRKDPTTGKWKVVGYTWGTTDPDDGEGCCFVPFELQACKDEAEVYFLCLKDCETVLDKMMNEELSYKGTDLLNYFQKLGMTYDESLKFMAWYSFAFRTQRTIAQGLTNLSGVPGLRPFHGIAEVMSHKAVTPLKGTDIIGGFAQAGCVLDVLNAGGSSNYAIFVHPLGYAAIDEVITEGRNGKLPAGWARRSGSFAGQSTELYFKGIPVVKDPYVPKDLENTNTFEAYIIDTSTTRVSMKHPELMIPESAIRTGQTLDPDDNCTMVICDIYENAGVAHSSNYARNILIADMPLGANCSAGVFSRVQNALDGTVPFPMATIPAE